MSSFVKNIRPTIKKIEEILGLSIKIFIITALVVIFLGVYVANLIYGDNSLHVLQHLQKEKSYLKSEISHLKDQNAKLHKKYLEWTDAQSAP
jgi:cell division protein FtsB